MFRFGKQAAGIALGVCLLSAGAAEAAGSGFDIIVVDGIVRRVEIGERNGIQTKARIAVGTDLNALIAAYGQPDAIHGDHYIYFADNSRTIGLSFEIENNRVDEIEMGILY